MENNKEKIEYIKQSFEFKHQKKYKEAIEMLYKALECNTEIQDNVELLSQAGDLHVLLNNYDRAIEEFQRALAINDCHGYSLQKLFDIYVLTNQYQKALKTAQDMCEKQKTTHNYYNYFKILILLNKHDDAFGVFNALDESIKMDVDILYLLSTISSPEKKQLLLEKILELDEAHTMANVGLAGIEFKKGNYNKVVQYCLSACEENSLIDYYLANVEASKNNYTKAIELIHKAIELDNNEHDFYLTLAKFYIDISWLDEALLAIKKSINIDLIKNIHDSLDEKYFLAGWILIKQNQISKALLNLNTIKKDSPYYTKAQILIQTINIEKQDLSSALIELEKHYVLERDNLILLDTLAYTYKELNQYKKAINIYKEALRLYPNSIYYHLELIDLLIDNTQYDSAIEIINNLRAKNENCVNIYNSLARIYYRINKKEQALEAINTYLELDNNNQEAYYFKGLILNDLSRFEEAKKSIFIAINLNPAIAKYYNQMARSYFGLKQYEDALLYSKEAIELNQNEISYKKQAYEIALEIGNQGQIELYESQLRRSEEILKFKR